jgi:ribonuclease P protein component
VLVALPNEHTLSRFAVSAGRSVGNAIERNRAKRLIRESIRPLIPIIPPGWDVLLLARNRLESANLEQTRVAVENLLKQASLLQDDCGK